MTPEQPGKRQAPRKISGKRVLLLVLLVLVLPGLLLVGTLAWLGTSEEGTRLLARQATEWVPELTLEVEGGDLSSGLQLSSLRWANDTFQLEASDVSVSWKPACLSASEFCIASLDIARLELTLAPTPKDLAVRLPAITVPWALSVDSARVGEVIVNYAGDQSLRLSAAEAQEFALRDDQLSAGNLAFTYNEKPYAVHGQITLREDYPVQLELSAGLDESLPPILAQLRGSVQAMTFRVDAIDKLPLVLEGSVALLEKGLPLQATVRSAKEFDLPLGEVPVRLRRLSGELSGNASAISLALEGAVQTPSLDGDQSFKLAASLRPADSLVELQQVQAQLQGYPLRLQGALAWSAETGLQARQAVVWQGDNNLAIDGELFKAGLKWTLNVPQPQSYVAGLEGNITARGLVRYEKSMYDVGAALDASNLSYKGQQLSRAQLQCRWRGAAPAEPLQLRCQNLLLGIPAASGLPALTWISSSPFDLAAQWSQPRVSISPLCLNNREVPVQQLCSKARVQLSAQGVAGLELVGRELPLAWLEQLVRDNPVLPGTWNFSLSVPAGPQAPMNWTISAEEFGAASGSLRYAEALWSGSFVTTGVNVSPLLPVFSDLSELRGSLRADVNFQQDEHGIVLHGGAYLDNGHLDLFGMDTFVDQVNVALRLDGRLATLEGAVTVDHESVALNGHLDWQTLPWSAQLRLQAQNLVLEPLAGLVATVSTDLSVSATPDMVILRGEIVVPSARLDASRLSPGKNVIRLSPDTEIVGEKQSVFSGPDLDIKVALRLGDDVQFQGYGLFGTLRGALELEKTGKSPPQARGTIVLANGYFRAYGQDLDVEDGRLVFTGSPYNPDIRLRAHRRHTIDAAEVGIIADGPIEQPRLRLYSSVPMSEQERMHYLLTGRQIDAGRTPSDDAMGDAAIALGLAGANRKVGALGEQLGIQGFSLSTETGEQGQQAQVSGYFGPNLYIKYGHSLFEQSEEFSARYRLSDQLYIEGYQGTQSSLELLWFVRRRQQDEVYIPEQEVEFLESGARDKPGTDSPSPNKTGAQ